MDKDGLILECGCGSGRVVNYFHKNDFNIVGMDFSKIAIKNIHKSKSDSKVICADALCLPFIGKSFKYLCCFGVYGSFEHYNQRKQFLSEAYRVLKDDGILILSVASNNILYYTLYGLRQNNFVRSFFGKKKLPHYFGWYQFPKKQIKKELECSNFKMDNYIYAKTNQFFYDLFPFFRDKMTSFDRKDALRLERAGENVYPLSSFGKCVFKLLNSKSPALIATVGVTVSHKANT